MKKVSFMFTVLAVMLGMGLASCKNEIDETSGTKYEGIVSFGEWPQTIKAGSVTIDESETRTAGTFTYYKGSDGAWYARCTENACGANYTYSDGTTAAQSSANSTKYFKVEPIKWRVLTNDYKGNTLLLAEDILTAHRYAASSNNYKDSEIRTWLNGTFLNAAFSDSEKSRIATTTVDNSAASTNPDSNPNEFNGGVNPYACENTTDKIFLLSEQEVTKSEYGFAAYDQGGVGHTRIRMTTDYAKANYAYQFTTSGYGGWWWLRSPSYNGSNGARGVLSDGYARGNYVSNSSGGVCPALSISAGN